MSNLKSALKESGGVYDPIYQQIHVTQRADIVPFIYGSGTDHNGLSGA